MKRIEQKLLETYGELVDMRDYDGKPSEEIRAALLSRSTAACAIGIYTGATPQECADSITDGYGDLGIDAVFNDAESNELFLVQAKWIKDGNGSPALGDIMKFTDGVKHAISIDFTGANQKLQDKIAEIESALMNSNGQVRLLIAYSGAQHLSEEVTRHLDQLMTSLNDTSDVIQYSEVNQKKLYDTISGGADAVPINIDDIDLREWGKMETPYTTYYGQMSAQILASWWEDYGNRLFAKNIRHYKGSSETNEGIMKTLREEPSNFWYYNNGVKILCDTFSKKPIYGDDRSVGLFTATGLSIVNGAQTVGCIGAVGKIDPESLKNAKVFIQFISLENTPDGYGDRVTKLSNTQNRIDGRDFAALDPEQERIRRDLWMTGITYLYKGNIKPSIRTEVSIDEATIGLACFNSDIKLATLCKRNLGAFYENIEKEPYITLYNGKTNSVLIYNLVQILRYVEANITEKQHTASGRDRQILVHGNRFILHCITALQSLHDKMYIPQSPNALKSDVDAIFDKIFEYTREGIAEKYPENYLNSLFKNNQKCNDIFCYVFEHFEADKTN